jgi:glycosyltransferase involved in cell wall biosynthesis
MAAGLAVVSSDVAPCRRIVTETGCGRVYRSRDPSDLARAVEELSPEAVRVACGRAGRAAILARYNWEEDCARLNSALLGCLPIGSDPPKTPLRRASAPPRRAGDR